MISFFGKNYKYMIILPIVLLIIFSLLIFVTPGLTKGIDFKGGYQITVRYDGAKDYSNIKPALTEQFSLTEVIIKEIDSPLGQGLMIEFSGKQEIMDFEINRKFINFKEDSLENLKESSKTLVEPLVNVQLLNDSIYEEIEEQVYSDDLLNVVNNALNTAKSNFNNAVINVVKSELNLGDDAKIQIREIAATLGSDFVKDAIKVGIWAIILLIIVILLFFRELIPSGLILFSGAFDAFAALAGMSLLGVPLSLTTIPALLMLIGYSVDTDILLCSKLLKNKTENPKALANKTIKTGMTLTLTTLATVIVMLIISYFTQMSVVFEIAIILLFGLLADMIATWFFNAPLLITYVSRKKK